MASMNETVRVGWRIPQVEFKNQVLYVAFDGRAALAAEVNWVDPDDPKRVLR
jgi:hypothetical protein